jgi:hypothetical protein
MSPLCPRFKLARTLLALEDYGQKGKKDLYIETRASDGMEFEGIDRDVSLGEKSYAIGG